MLLILRILNPFNLFRFLLLREISLGRKLRHFITLVTLALGIALLPEVLSLFYDLSFLFLDTIYFPESFVRSAGVCVAYIVFNVLFTLFHHGYSIRHKWPVACQRTGLTMWQRQRGRGASKSEIPEIIKVTRNFFRVKMKGFKLSDFEDRKVNLGNSLEVFIWRIEETKRKGGRVPGQVDIYYSGVDLPLMIPLIKADPPRVNELNYGLSSTGWEKVTFQNFMHGGISGTSGGGKSILLRSFFTQILTCSPKSTVIVLDYKSGAEFFTFNEIPNIVVCENYGQSRKALNVLLDEYERRAEIVKHNDVDSVYDLSNTVKERENLHPVFLILDEAAEIFSKLPKATPQGVLKLQEDVTHRIDQVSRLTRFVGIHLIAASQVLSVEAIASSTRANLQTRISFRQFQAELSRIWLFGLDSARDLTKEPGRFLVIGKDGIMKEIQGLYIGKKEAKTAIKAVPRTPTELYRKIIRALDAADGKPDIPQQRAAAGNEYASAFTFKGSGGKTAIGKIVRN